jgi:hypothetical protein
MRHRRQLLRAAHNRAEATGSEVRSESPLSFQRLAALASGAMAVGSEWSERIGLPLNRQGIARSNKTGTSNHRKMLMFFACAAMVSSDPPHLVYSTANLSCRNARHNRARCDVAIDHSTRRHHRTITHCYPAEDHRIRSAPHSTPDLGREKVTQNPDRCAWKTLPSHI